MDTPGLRTKAQDTAQWLLGSPPQHTDREKSGRKPATYSQDKWGGLRGPDRVAYGSWANESSSRDQTSSILAPFTPSNRIIPLKNA